MGNENPQPLLFTAPTGAGLPQYHPAAGSYQAIPFPACVENQPQYRRSPLRRFIVSLFFAVGIYAALKTIFAFHHHHRHRTHGGHRWDIPANVFIDRCVSGSAWAVSDASTATGRASHRAAEATFEIPLTPDTVLGVSRHNPSSYFSQSPLLSGNLDITTSPHLKNTAKIVINSFYDTHELGNVMACLITGDDGETGVRIFTRRSWMGRGREATVMQIRLVLPQPEKPLQLKGLVTDLPNFSHNIGDLKNAIEFKSVLVRSSNAALRVKSLSAARAKLQTSNGAISANSLISADLILRTSNAGISGTFNTSSQLDLTTSNAPITVSVGLEHTNGSRPTRLRMRTSNHRLDAKVSLSTQTKSKGGDFDITGTTSNGPLKIEFPAAPWDAALVFTARTSNKPAEVTLHETYEGSLELATSQHSASLTRMDESGDKRKVDYEKAGRELKGYVYAKEANKERGRVKVTSSNAPVVLFV
ncbi:hypothetical protein DFH09DRAFT_1152897 [Mycena vulgaris]|nr:hypothetical protein DFH09DRAFT_1152897 [Mycena vulgaris]